MDRETPIITKILFIFCGAAFALPALFFAYYTIRLIWLNLTLENAADYRSTGMLIGAIAFPLAAIIFGFMSWFFIKRGFIKK
ncbi:MAG: hypothetical protein KA956_09370 [Pyrinomonadaceae bacterium]|nr:hypothetical protein [Acidobacteriota bacterium]MBK7932344.1 hypothetical protein [Acidobacteriota bacterium]MBP7376677.1 hypothetical protein [Pyrinomonadaceae bacterium]